ncbi:MAG: 50S ribosome-binding GTPase [Bacteroidaceae bacterium]|nr:50S ribosome-binding GTPase [Bacteroidaceae bacterium]
MAEVVCPYCFKTFKQKEVMFRCKNSTCPGIDDDEILMKHWEQYKIQVPKKSPAIRPRTSFFSGTPKEATCPSCKQETYWMICPHCHNRIDNEMVLNPGKIISIVGSRNSGKTVYITALIEQLKRYGHKMGQLGIMESTVADDRDAITSIRFKKDFLTPLFKEGQCPDGTKVMDKYREVPLIYTINQAGRPPLHLVLYDTAGENFKEGNEANIQNNLRFLSKSDAVIFLFDITNIPDILEKLVECGLNFEEAEHDVQQVVASLSNQKEIKERLLNIPKAVVFNKIDLYLDYLTESMGEISDLRKGVNSSFIDGHGINMDVIDGASDALQKALIDGMWGSEGAQLWINFPKKAKSDKDTDPLVHLFGVSALGKNPVDRQVLDAQGKPDVKPYRVLDPLVWILYKLGYKLNMQ